VAVDFAADLGFLVTDSRVYKDICMRSLYEKGVKAKPDTVLPVGFRLLFPQDLGHRPEHWTTVQEERTV
jgi:hypothetical protein